MRLPEHGSNPQHLFKALNFSTPNDIVDFSVNVNPFGMPKSIEQQWANFLGKISDYPDPHSTVLKTKLAKREAINVDEILIGNGAAELIFILAQYLRKENILIVDPTFSEYRTACNTYGCQIESVPLTEENGWQLDVEQIIENLTGKAAVFICNPNNPTGVRYDRNALLTIVDAAHKLNVLIIVDEAFYDFCVDPYTLVPHMKTYPNLIILRSFTKMFAIAGIRLGWLAANPQLISELSALKPHWSVNAIAEKIGLLCLDEEVFVQQTAQQIKMERQRMMTQVTALDFIVSNSKTNYYLLRDKKKRNLEPLLRFLLEEGITARHTENFINLSGNYLRFAVRTARENNRLITALKRWRQACSSS